MSVLIEEFGCDTSIKGVLSRSLLHSACSGGSVNLVRTLILKHEADINARDEQKSTPLHLAVYCGKEEVVSLLIEEFDCDISRVKGVVGRSLLHIACYGDNVNLVRTLILNHKADINARDDENNTPLENYGTSQTHIDVFPCYIWPLTILMTPYLAHALHIPHLSMHCYSMSINIISSLI